jgi:hypothetical protein
MQINLHHKQTYLTGVFWKIKAIEKAKGKHFISVCVNKIDPALPLDVMSHKVQICSTLHVASRQAAGHIYIIVLLEH